MTTEYLTIEHVPTKDLTRIFSKIEIDPITGCWIWTGCRKPGHYGQTYWNNRLVAPHRLMFAWLVHPIPRNQYALVLDHQCENKFCCNPAHLAFVTARTNILRGNGTSAIHARKTACVHGHPLTGDNVKIDILGRRVCRTCKKTRDAEYVIKFKQDPGRAAKRKATVKRYMLKLEADPERCQLLKERRNEYKRQRRALSKQRRLLKDKP